MVILERKLKEQKEKSEEKLKQSVAHTVLLKQEMLKMEEELKACKQDLAKKEGELDNIIRQYDTLNHQHQCLGKE